MSRKRSLGDCCVSNCHVPASGRNYCNKHYQLWYRYGTVTPDTNAIRKSLLESRFQKNIKISSTTGCHIWQGSKDSLGYGRVTRGGKHKMAHRIAWEMKNGPIPPGLFGCHKCDTPSCVNPDHLFLGTIQENFDDMRQKGRHPFGERIGMSKLSDKKVVAILKDKSKATVIAEKYGVSAVLIGKIKRREIWTHISNVAEPCRKAKLHVSEIQKIREAKGTQRRIAEKFNITQSMVSCIKLRKTWIHV